MSSLRVLTWGTAIAASLAAQPALAHPHIFAEARLEVMVAPDGTVSSLRNVWRFDEAFSSSVILDFDKNKNLKLDPDELHELGQTIHASLSDYHYFQMVTANGKDMPIKPPPELFASMEDGQLIVLFEAGTKDPVRLVGKIAFGIYDPTFYTAIDITDDKNMVVDGLPEGCNRKVVRPDPDEALKQNQKSLTEAFFNDPTNDDIGRLFATRLEVTCR